MFQALKYCPGSVLKAYVSLNNANATFFSTPIFAAPLARSRALMRRFEDFVAPSNISLLVSDSQFGVFTATMNRIGTDFVGLRMWASRPYGPQAPFPPGFPSSPTNLYYTSSTVNFEISSGAVYEVNVTHPAQTAQTLEVLLLIQHALHHLCHLDLQYHHYNVDHHLLLCILQHQDLP